MVSVHACEPKTAQGASPFISPKKKAMGLTHGLYIAERGPRAAFSLPAASLNLSCVLAEEGRLVPKAKKAEIKNVNLLSSFHRYPSFYFFSGESQ